jgi:S-adenosylmethionine:tRNA ribosyltransferase-isomerase
MTDPRTLSIKDFTYCLPEDRIAKYPLPERDASKLLIYKEGKITEDIFQNIAEHIPAGSHLFFNDSKVIEARLFFQKPTGGIIEIFCLEPHSIYPDIATAMMQFKKVVWHCLVGGASKWKKGFVPEKKIFQGTKSFTLRAKYIEKLSDCFVIEFSWDAAALSFAEVLHRAGAIPLPPYIKRDAEVSDAERYQTIYAQHDGSVAAPTAGLHFTERIFKQLKAKNIFTDFVTLHIGAGTFKPVKSETMQEHEMHAEYIKVSAKTVENILRFPEQNIIAAGTTSLRAIESLYWLGVKLYLIKDTQPSELTQWESYELEKYKLPVRDALQALLDYMKKSELDNFPARTKMLIAPGYKPKIANAIITNFHLPNSTLLLLVAALTGDDWKDIYNYALRNNFRFLSYGDSSLLWCSPQKEDGLN